MPAGVTQEKIKSLLELLTGGAIGRFLRVVCGFLKFYNNIVVNITSAVGRKSILLFSGPELCVCS